MELNVENFTLRVGLVEDDIHASIFNERSAGLRMFVALSAFLSARASDRRTILLIDEAETHLHVDAQGDLVEMFAVQDRADKVIYTTHSPACLPADLGVGIRAVVADSEETSHVENSFWNQAGTALSSLMFAMGASAAAFTPARCAVVAEGPSDMVALPTLIRSATRLAKLPYQVVPGLSEMPPELYPDLDFEAAKVAFVVDGDTGGEDLAKALGRDVPAHRIVSLDVPGLENLLDPTTYSELFVSLVRQLNPGRSAEAEPPVLGDPTRESWAKMLARWADDEGLSRPTKVHLASELLELADQPKPLLSPFGTSALQKLHIDLSAALGLHPPRPAARRKGRR